MANVIFDKHNNEYRITLNDGREERVSWEAWFAIMNYHKENDMREEARFRTENIYIELSDDDLDEMANIYERSYESDRSECSQWDDAVDHFMTTKRIEDYFGRGYEDFELDDCPRPYGGKSHTNETLGEFMNEVGLNGKDSLYRLNEALEVCGVEINR